MCKNTGQPDFNRILKRPSKGHRLCNPFRMTHVFYPNPFDPNPYGLNPNSNSIDSTRLPGLVNINYEYTNCVQGFLLFFNSYDRI